MPETIDVEAYLGQGGVLTSPANAPPRYRGELLRTMASFVDSELSGSAGFADLINAAPGLKERIAAARIVLEKTDHAERVLALMAEFGADVARYAAHRPWAARLSRETAAPAARSGEDSRLSVFHYPLQGWTDAVAFNVVMGCAAVVQIEELAHISYAPLAEALRFIAPRERRHAELGVEGLKRIVATPQGRAEAQASLAYWRPRVAETFGAANPARFALLSRLGLRRRANAELLADWRAQLDAALSRSNLVESPMTDILPSYLCGAWTKGAGPGALARDAATGAPVACIDATSLDVAAALDFARTRGGPALRALDFHARANLLKALAQALTARKEELYQLSFATGATRADSAIDIEGGIGVLFAYASRGRRELPARTFLVEGEAESLTKDGSFAARHILTSLRGVAVHIDAFNFPVWGMLEKLAPSLLAGMPALVKPASQTAYLTELAFRMMIDSGALPEGALQLLCGGAGDLVDHLTGQDVVSFTGSAATGAKLRAHPRIVSQSVRFGCEADSLNACLLAPDSAPGTPEFDLFVREVAREMTAKAGQKCTAIRRALVPRAHAQAVVAALGDRLASVKLGDPRDEATRMGPLASLAQREEVLARIADIAREAEIVAGSPAAADGPGAFLAPVLLYCDRPGAARAPHEIEAFGPVACVLPYDDFDEALALANRGGGSLAASVFTDDEVFAREAVLALGHQHGRVLIGNRASAKTSTGHGSPLPGLIHGGPGRAGGAEEMGGIRGVKHFMQRTAVQGSPRLLAAVTGQWSDGAPVRDAPPHPFRKSLAELKIGDRIVTATREVTLADIEHFAHFTGDNFYAHMDEAAAQANPLFGGRVAHGYLIVSFAAGLFVDPAPGPVLANYGVDNLRFLTPVKPGDTLQATLTAKDINPRSSAEHGEVRWDCQVTNQTGTVVARYDVLTMVAKTWG